MTKPTTSKIDEAQDKLGELFIIGIEGKSLADESAAFISQAKIGGILLFAHNYETPPQVAKLINEIQECRTERALWIAVDQEGGRVQRFKTPFTILPKGMTLGATGSPKLAFELAELQAKELKAVGVNLNFCPVADIMTNPSNPVIGDRAYGTEEEIVTKMVTAMVRGHVTQGVQPCVKHFPGHGDTDKDSHFDLPSVTTPLETLREREFKPFSKAFKSRCAMVMTAHILNPTIDPKFPATLSKITLQEILRKELRYSGLIISDDLEMQAITDHYGAEDAPRMALEAGCDLLIYRTEKAARHAYAALFKALENGSLSADRVLESAALSHGLKKDVLGVYHPVTPSDFALLGCAEHLEFVKKIG